MTNPVLQEILEGLEAAVKFREENRSSFFQPYPKQQEFFDAGAWARERLLMAGNQQGKSEAGAFEVACHLTGEYPEDWMGYRWERPIVSWAAGESSLSVRDIGQTKLCGVPGLEGSLGTGMIPKAAFADKPSLARGVADGYDTIFVTHKSGGKSILRFKSYEQGRGKFQGPPIDLIWLDEEAPPDVYSECLARIAATRGRLFTTFTPLKGMSEVVGRFINEKSPDRSVTNMTIDDALHIPKEEREKIIAGYAPHERDARVRGIPMLGSGRIFQYSEDAIAEPPLTYVPPHWVKLWGIDFGIDHPFGAVLIIWDRDNDCIHVHAALKVKDQMPLQHSEAMKPIGIAVPVAWPHDGNNRDKGSGEPLAAQYRKHGLTMCASHATWEDGGYSTEAGIMEMQQRMAAGKLKVAAQLSLWFEEFRQYHRKDGQIVKVNDDLMSATRIAIMAKRYARAVPLGGKKPARGPDDNVARDVALSASDLFG